MNKEDVVQKYSGILLSHKRNKILPFAATSISSVAQSCPTLWDPMDCSTPDFPVQHQLLELVQTHVHRVGDAIQPSYPLLTPSPPTFNLSKHQGLFKWVSSSHQVATVLGFHLQHIQELISFRMDWLYLLADQGTLKSLLQHHSSKASVFLRSAFFTVQLSHPYMLLHTLLEISANARY